MLQARPTKIFDLSVTWIGAHPSNQWPTDDNLQKIAVVNHRAQGSVAGMDSWFWDPRAQASAHFGVPAAPGPIHQYVDLIGRAPYANGVAYDQTPAPNDPRLLRNYMSTRALNFSTYFRWASQNKWTISIEYAGSYGEPLTPFQIEAGAKINAYIILNTPLRPQLPPSSLSPVIEDTAAGRMWSHSEFDAINRAHCHGLPQTEWNQILTRAQQLIQGQNDNQGQNGMTPEEKAAFQQLQNDLKTLRDDFMYWVIGSHKPWLERLHAQVNSDILPRLQNLEAAIPVIRQILGEQGQRIQALESKFPTNVFQTRVPAIDALQQLDFITQALTNYVSVEPFTQPQSPNQPQPSQPPASYLEFFVEEGKSGPNPEDYTINGITQQEILDLASRLENMTHRMRVAATSYNLAPIQESVGVNGETLVKTPPSLLQQQQETHTADSGEADNYPDAHGDMPEEYKNL